MAKNRKGRKRSKQRLAMVRFKAVLGNQTDLEKGDMFPAKYSASGKTLDKITSAPGMQQQMGYQGEETQFEGLKCAGPASKRASSGGNHGK